MNRSSLKEMKTNGRLVISMETQVVLQEEKEQEETMMRTTTTKTSYFLLHRHHPRLLVAVTTANEKRNPKPPLLLQRLHLQTTLPPPPTHLLCPPRYRFPLTVRNQTISALGCLIRMMMRTTMTMTVDNNIILSLASLLPLPPLPIIIPTRIIIITRTVPLPDPSSLHHRHPRLLRSHIRTTGGRRQQQRQHT